MSVLAHSIAFAAIETHRDDSIQTKVIGQWIDRAGSFEQRISIVQEAETLFRIARFRDGSTARTELVEVAAKPGERRRFRDKHGPPGEQFVIDAAGNLDLYDAEGLIREAKKVTGRPSSSRPG